MRYTHSINAVKCQEWGLNLNQGALFDLLNQSFSWAEPQVVDGKVYYWVSRNKVLDEIPLAYKEADTVYRALKLLAKKELIIYKKDGKKDLISLTAKGKTWNVKGTVIGDQILGDNSDNIDDSEIDPSKFGNKSENNSDSDPTDKNTISNKNINNKREKSAPDNLTLTDQQIAVMTDYGLIDKSDLMISSFLANGKSKGLKYECWASAFTLWINREIDIKNLVSASKKPMIDTRSNSQSNFSQSDNSGYHPSQSAFSDQSANQPTNSNGTNWHWTEPFPTMSISQTIQYIKDHKFKGENVNKAYSRLLNQLQEAS